MTYRVDQELAQIPCDVELPTAWEIAKSSISNTITTGAITAGVSVLTTKLDGIYHPVSQACLQSTEAANTFAELLRPDLLFRAVYSCGPDIASHPMIQEAMQNGANAGLIVGTALLAVAGIRAISTWFELKLKPLPRPEAYQRSDNSGTRRIKSRLGTEYVTPFEEYQDYEPELDRINETLGTERTTSVERINGFDPVIEGIREALGKLIRLKTTDKPNKYYGVDYIDVSFRR